MFNLHLKLPNLNYYLSHSICHSIIPLFTASFCNSVPSLASSQLTFVYLCDVSRGLRTMPQLLNYLTELTFY